MRLEQTADRLRSALDSVTGELMLNHPDHPRFDLDHDPAQHQVRLSDADPVLALVPLEHGGHPDSPNRHHPHRPTLWGAAAATTAACVATIVGLVLIPAPSNSAKASAATVLAEAERNVTSGGSPRPGQFLYEKTASMEAMYGFANGHSWLVDLPATTELWMGSRGHGRERYVPGAPIFASEADRTAWVAAGSPSLAQAFDETFPDNRPVPKGPGRTLQQRADSTGNLSFEIAEAANAVALPYPDLARLPTDPTTLHKALVKQILATPVAEGVASTTAVFIQSANLLVDGTTAAQRVALYKVISSLPGVTLAGTVTTDVSHKSGTALSLAQNANTVSIVIDQTTGNILEQRFTGILPSDSSPIPTGTGNTSFTKYIVYQDEGIVDSTTSFPVSSH
jgi:hypothetical protein